MESKWSQKPSKMHPKNDAKIDAKNNEIAGAAVVAPVGPGNLPNQQDFLRKNNKKENNLQKTYLKTN